MGGPLRVLHVVVNMNRGGAETLIMNLYRNIDRSKVQFDFLTSKEGVFDSEIRELGGEIHRIPYVTDVGHFGYIKALNSFFKKNSKYRIVHSHMDKMSGWVLRAAKKANVPVRIAHSHSTKSEGSVIGNLYKWYAGTHIPKYSSNRIACSVHAGKWLFKNNSFHVIKNGIDLDRFRFSLTSREKKRKELGIDHDAIVIGHIGRFSEPKNHHYLLKIFADYLKGNKNSILLLVGDGPLRRDIEKKAYELKIENKIKFLGVRDDIDHLIHAFDLFVFPSLYEGLPVTLIEAQCSGVPCYVSDQVTKEVDLGLGLLKFLPLGNDVTWTTELLSIPSNTEKRAIFNRLLNNSEFDIRRTTQLTQDIYLQ